MGRKIQWFLVWVVESFVTHGAGVDFYSRHMGLALSSGAGFLKTGAAELSGFWKREPGSLAEKGLDVESESDDHDKIPDGCNRNHPPSLFDACAPLRQLAKHFDGKCIQIYLIAQRVQVSK